MPLSPYELRREQMILERKAFLHELFPEGELAALKRDIAPKKRTPVATKSKPVTRSPRLRKPEQPLRRSERLSSSGTDRKSYRYSESSDMLEVPRCRRTRRSLPSMPVELREGSANLDPNDLSRIAQTTSEKVYDPINGTSCHQCRQKTLDLKTTCRNKNCVGIRGQFCGPCLRNRYGEDIVDACKNEKWVCPPCREICNCSFCLAKRGRRPTGILIHTARDNGYASVHSYLKAASVSE